MSNTAVDRIPPEDEVMEDRGTTLTDQLIESVAYVAATLADLTPASKHYEIPALMREWTRAEARLTAFRLRDLSPGLTDVEQATQDALERRIARAILTFVKGSLPKPGIDLSSDPRGGAALRLVWDGCERDGQPRNAFAGGLIVLL